MKKLIILSLVILLSLSFVLAQDSDYIFKQSENNTLKVYCFNNASGFCDNSITCQVSVQYPNTSQLVNNQSMYYGISFFGYNLTGSQLNTLGEYSFFGICSGTNSEPFDGTFLVTTTGQQVSLSNIIVVLIFLFLAGLFLTLAFSFDKETKWYMRSFFFICSILMGILSVNSGRIIASESTSLTSMSQTGFITVIIILLVMFLYFFIYATINIIKAVKDKRAVRWEY